MKRTPALFFNKRFSKGAGRLFRLISATLCIFLLTAVPALADPITVREVVQTLNSSQGTLDLRLNTLVAQDPAKTGTQQNGPRNENAQGNQGATKSESIISGVAITSEGQQLGVDIYDEEGIVEGTICDCGEIPPIGGFPKWPFLFLAAVPLAFIDTCDSCEEQTTESPTPTPTPTPTVTPTPPSNPTPTPTPPEVPEPGSLFLLGTGLAAAGAGLRRRYAKMKMNRQTQEEE